jgi:hypothetical protein
MNLSRAEEKPSSPLMNKYASLINKREIDLR